MNLVHCTHGHPNPAGNRFCQHCGEPIVNGKNQTLSSGVTLGDRYRIVRELGKGGFGQAYLAQDSNRFNELCVLKEFAPQVQGDYALQKAQELFEREAGVLYKLQHPQIPKFRALFRVSDPNRERLFLVQDYVDGQTYSTALRARKQQGVGFTEAEVIQLLQDILPVLGYIHSMGVIHRDISPDNLILRTSDRKPILIDFGGVKEVAAKAELQFSPAALAGQSTIIPTRLGKAGYAPREQMQRGVVSPQSDLYALAATALALLTGKEPYELIDNQTVSWNWAIIGYINPKLQNILDRMLQPIPGDRFASAYEVLQALNAPEIPVFVQPTYSATAAVNPSGAGFDPPLVTPLAEPDTGATVAVSSPIPIAPPPSKKGWGGLGQFLLGLLIIGGAGALGWFGGTWWIRSQVSRLAPSPSLSPVTPATSSPTSSATPVQDEESQRQQALQQRRQNLEIEPTFYEEVVNQVFGILNPAQKDKAIGDTPEEATLRSQRDKVADDLLTQIEQANLSAQVRKDLGTYNSADRQQWVSRVNRLRLSSRALNDLVDARFNVLFPQYNAKTLNEDFEQWLNTPIAQFWSAIAAETVPLLESKTALETIQFDPGAASQQLSGTLKLGEGKAYIAQLTAGQTMELKLDAPAQIEISVYSPSGKVRILEDSNERSWSGNLPESGYYEIILTSNSQTQTDYKLDLNVTDGALSPTSSPAI